MAGPTGSWYLQSREIGGILLDISGVLYDSGEGGGTPISGSIDAVKRLKSSGVPVRFCTNETQMTKVRIVAKLRKLGFDMDECEVFCPAPAVKQILKDRGLRPHLLLHPDAMEVFSDMDQTNPNCVVVGDASDNFTYANLNTAFRVLFGIQNPVLFTLGIGKYYKETSGLMLDVGPYTKALEYACDVTAEVVGKPSPLFFNTALQDMGITAQQAVMIGDDIVNDVGGAQACGLKGIQVRTGKYRLDDEPHASVTPDGYVDNLAQAVDLFIKHR